jgi:D-alanine--poly(phosphoribitol) ligase subunit 1
LALDLLHEAPAAYTIDPATSHGIDIPIATNGKRHELAYLIFTSGSTGEPKGVMISRAALAHFVNWVRESETVRVGDRISQHPNIAFDLSVLDIYGALCSGATLVPLLSETDRLMPERFIQREQITVWNSVPSVINLMAKSRRPLASTHSVRLFSFCGEPLLKEHLEVIFKAYPDAVVQNTYGPTEATVSMTEIRLTRSNYLSACRTSVALGNPVPGMGFHLIGGKYPTEGELVITGPQLAEGYWNDPELTETKFKPVTVGGKSLRGYYTGDWVECIGGMYFFKERIDFQIKIRGFRIELDEVEAAIRKCGWPVVCSFKWEETLVAVIEGPSDEPLDSAKLRTSVAAYLEPHAIPEFIASIPQMPRNENDKIDRKAVISWYARRADEGVE